MKKMRLIIIVGYLQFLLICARRINRLQSILNGQASWGGGGQKCWVKENRRGVELFKFSGIGHIYM